MFVNKMTQLYKPKRVLFYRDIKHGEVEEILGGGGMSEFDKYKNAFGTYDAPGIFYIASKDEPVIGVEFRMDDPRINYPENMESIVLNESFFYSLEIDNEISFSKDTIKELMEEAEKLSDRIGIMNKGDLIDIGTLSELLKKTKTKNLEDAFISLSTGGEL